MMIPYLLLAEVLIPDNLSKKSIFYSTNLNAPEKHRKSTVDPRLG